MNTRSGIAVVGASGRLGRDVLRRLDGHPTLALAAAVVRPGSAWATGAPAEFANLPVSTDLAAVAGPAAILDVSTPAALPASVAAARAAGVPLVVGTTGLDGAGEGLLDEASAAIPVLEAANFSLGVTLALGLLADATRALDRAGVDADVEIVEAHHAGKVDAPSGTALRMGEAIAAARGRRLDEVAVYDRTSGPGRREPGSIGFQSLRAGDIVGEHTVLLSLEGERLELTHRAGSRSLFAAGALRAVAWLLEDRAPGRYTMADVAGLART